MVKSSLHDSTDAKRAAENYPLETAAMSSLNPTADGPAALKQKPDMKSIVSEWLLLIAGTFLLAVGVYFFVYPNNFATGGVAGLSVVVSALIPFLSQANASLVINVVLLVLGMIIIGKQFAFKTTFVTLLLSGLLVLFEHLIPLDKPLTNQPLLELFISIAIIALGQAILFNKRASSGGTDIIAMIIRKYSSMDIGKALLASDFLITLTTFFIFDIETGLFSMTGLFIKGIIVDGLMESFNRVKYFTIVTSKPKEIGDFINYSIRRGSTKLLGKGGYTGEERTVFLCVVQRYQAVVLRDYVREIDPQAFMMITNTSEIVGLGFHQPF